VTVEWLFRALEESRARGFLGPGAIEPHIAHAEGFAKVWEGRFPDPPSAFVDLGSGGGLPGLVLLERWGCRGVLIDSILKRVAFLSEALAWPGAPTTGEVVGGRIEEVARDPELDGQFDLVTARSFGPPSVTAECAARFLRVGGVLIVSEPPDDQAQRWPTPGLAKLGLESVGRVRHGAAYHEIVKVAPTPGIYPRAVGVPAKKLLF
jgi:16S rRNA (guanine527-N7)-methyltransferase